MIKIKRAYEPPRRQDGKRVLVDRLWPRGVRRSELRLDAWLKDLAPSAALRRWFGHEPEKWAGFRRRYAAELDVGAAADAVAVLRRAARGRTVTLVYGARDECYNNAVALRAYLAGPKRQSSAKKPRRILSTRTR